MSMGAVQEMSLDLLRFVINQAIMSYVAQHSIESAMLYSLL